MARRTRRKKKRHSTKRSKQRRRRRHSIWSPPALPLLASSSSSARIPLMLPPVADLLSSAADIATPFWLEPRRCCCCSEKKTSLSFFSSPLAAGLTMSTMILGRAQAPPAGRSRATCAAKRRRLRWWTRSHCSCRCYWRRSGSSGTNERRHAVSMTSIGSVSSNRAIPRLSPPLLLLLLDSSEPGRAAHPRLPSSFLTLSQARLDEERGDVSLLFLCFLY